MSDLFHLIWWADSRQAGLQFHATPMIKSVITDPPFGINNYSKQALTEYGKEMARKIANDRDFDTAWETFTQVMDATFPGMLPESDVYVFTSQVVVEKWLVALKEYMPKNGFEYKGLGIWEKDGPGMGDHQTWGQGFEIILYFKRGMRQSRTKKVNMIFHISQVRPNKLIHPHEKPETLLIKLIEHSTDKGELIYDPFGGSGSVVRAARACGRSAIAVELDKKNYDLALTKLMEEEGLF